MSEQITFIAGIDNSKRRKDIAIKRNWENAFQRWSDKMNLESTDSYGKCGYGVMCDYCEDLFVDKSNRCVKALNDMCKEQHIKINYEKRDFEAVWRGELK